MCNDYKDGGSKSVDIVHENVLGYKSFTMIIFMNGKSLLWGILIDIEVNIWDFILIWIYHPMCYITSQVTIKIWFNVGSNISPILQLHFLWLFHNIYGLIAI